MADAKITQLNEVTTPANADVIAMVDDPAGSPETKKLTWVNILNGIKTWLNSQSIDEVSDVDTTTDPVAKNDVLMYNGSDFVPVVEGTTFTFSCTSFSDGQSTLKLIGSGNWMAAEAISFTAVYENGPPTTADIQKSINGAAY